MRKRPKGQQKFSCITLCVLSNGLNGKQIKSVFFQIEASENGAKFIKVIFGGFQRSIY